MTLCLVHCQRTEFQHDDSFCNSVLDTGAQTLVLKIRVKIDAVQRLQVRSPDCFLGPAPRVRPRVIATYTGDPILSTEVTTIERGFEAAIDKHWNGKLQLVPLNASGGAIACSVQLEFVHDAHTVPHLKARVIKNPVQSGARRTHSRDSYPEPLPFRANCWANSDPAGIDMTIHWNGVDWDSSFAAPDGSGDAVPLEQNTLAHEFGHYLGLGHSCHTPSNTAVGWCRVPSPAGPSDYCERTTEEQMNRIMAMGNRVVRENGTPWQRRLVRFHHYGCIEGYAPELVPTP